MMEAFLRLSDANNLSACGDGERPGSGKVVEDGREEEEKDKRLSSIACTVFVVDFPLPLTIAHSRAVAVSRKGIHMWMNAGARKAVHNLVDIVHDIHKMV